MKKSIPFLLASLAATSSLLFHTQEAKAAYKKMCETKMTIYLDFYEIEKKQEFTISAKMPPSLNRISRRPLTFKDKKLAIKEFKKLCKGS